MWVSPVCSTRVIATLLPLRGYIGSASGGRAAKREQGLLTLAGKNRPTVSLSGIDRRAKPIQPLSLAEPHGTIGRSDAGCRLPDHSHIRRFRAQAAPT